MITEWGQFDSWRRIKRKDKICYSRTIRLKRPPPPLSPDTLFRFRETLPLNFMLSLIKVTKRLGTQCSEKTHVLSEKTAVFHSLPWRTAHNLHHGILRRSGLHPLLRVCLSWQVTFPQPSKYCRSSSIYPVAATGASTYIHPKSIRFILSYNPNSWCTVVR